MSDDILVASEQALVPATQEQDDDSVSNVSFTEVLNKYRGIWNKLKDEEKIVYVYINMLEEQKCIDINEII